MSFEEQSALLRRLKGAGASILWILLLSGRRLTAVELERATGYSDKPVRQALRELAGMGLVVHHGKRRGWQVRKGLRAAILRWLREAITSSQ
jgi:DNA-binding GntR family transcriptional regulator